VDDVDAAVAVLQDEGVPVLSLPQDDREGRYRLAAVADPDGNPITLREPLPSGS
jgi:catechol 2,3-dioxygenase-like lactoylglutathione lyase family enzyme